MSAGHQTNRQGNKFLCLARSVGFQKPKGIIGVASYGAPGHVPPPRLPTVYFFQLTLWQRLCAVASPNFLYSATGVVVVQSQRHEPCSEYYFASFYVRQKFSRSFVPIAADPGDPLKGIIVNFNSVLLSFQSGRPTWCNLWSSTLLRSLDDDIEDTWLLVYHHL